MNYIVSSLKLVLLGLFLLVLTACSTLTTGESGLDEPYYVASVDIDASMTQAEVEATYGGKALVYKPDAGFAVLSFSQQEGRVTTLATSVNNDAFSSPEVAASGYSSWASGYSAWASGYSSWASGYSAWASGWDRWTSSQDAPELPSANATLWNQVNLYEAHDVSNNFGEGVKIAILDTGIDLKHPLLADRLAPSREWKDFVDNDSWPQERGNSSDAAYGHGTAVAGIIAQVAPRATILPLRVLDKDGQGDLDDVIAAIDWAVEQGADIINMSLGTYEYYGALHKMINYAAEQKIMMVASTGNDGKNSSTLPAQMAWWSDDSIFPYLYAIGSVDNQNRVSSFSNYANNISQAPGEKIVTAYPGEKLTRATGTSFAAPVFTGALALALGDYHIEDPYSFFVYAGNTGKWPSNYTSSGYGLLDAKALLETAQGKSGYSLIAEGWLNNFTLWHWTENAAITSNGWRDNAAVITGRGGFGQTVKGLRPNTTYTLTAYLRNQSSNGSVSIGVKNYSGSPKYATTSSTSWQYQKIQFTTGPNDTSVEIVAWNNKDNTVAYVDGFWLGR